MPTQDERDSIELLLKEAREEGYDEGCAEGRHIGYTEGYERGRHEGYQEGYDHGICTQRF